MMYYMLVGEDGQRLFEVPIISTQKDSPKYLVSKRMIAVILDIDPDLCIFEDGHFKRDWDVMARHVLEVHTTKDGWYIPEDTSEWNTIWQAKKENES